MAFGSLATVVPTTTTLNTLFYTAPSSTMVEGKVYITNRNSFPIKVRVAISTGGLNDLASSNYIIYDKEIDKGGTYQSDTTYFADGQSLIIKSNDLNVSFNLIGSEVGITTNSGLLSSLTPSQVYTPEVLYSAPSSGNPRINANLFACNRTSFPATIRVGVGTTVAASEYIQYNYELSPNSVYSNLDLKIGQSDIIFVRSSDTNVNFVLCGTDI